MSDVKGTTKTMALPSILLALSTKNRSVGWNPIQCTHCWHFHCSMELFICFWDYLVTLVHPPVLRKTQSILCAACLSNFSISASLTKTKDTSPAAWPPACTGRASCPAVWTGGSPGISATFGPRGRGLIVHSKHSFSYYYHGLYHWVQSQLQISK